MESTVRIVGTGHMASHLTRMMMLSGVRVMLYGRDSARVVAHATEWGCIYGGEISAITEEDVLTLLAVSDDHIHTISQQLSPNVPVVHLSGMTDISVLQQSSAGVCWPLQSMHGHNIIDYPSVPWFLEAKNDSMLVRLEHVFRNISNSVHRISSEQRVLVHAAAVFANNFSNHLIGKAGQILDKLEISRSVLLPILDLNLRSIHDHKAEEIQTGPARRGDIMTIQKQLESLAEYPELAELYQQLSRSILKDYHS
ncbi:MAG: Rossmann-like and DUF2520 domain-containing protein [Flavobacteriales bacterium]